MHTGGSSAVEQRTVKCASAYAVILWSGVQISPPGCFCLHFFFLCPQNHAGFGAFQTDEALRSHDSSVHSTRVVFIPYFTRGKMSITGENSPQQDTFFPRVKKRKVDRNVGVGKRTRKVWGWGGKPGKCGGQYRKWVITSKHS